MPQATAGPPAIGARPRRRAVIASRIAASGGQPGPAGPALHRNGTKRGRSGASP